MNRNKVNQGTVVLVALGLMPVSFFLYGVVLSKLWQWFVMPLFESAPPLTILSAIGLGMIISYVTPSGESKNKYESTSDAVSSMLASVFGKPVLTLFIGWIVFQLM